MYQTAKEREIVEHMFVLLGYLGEAIHILLINASSFEAEISFLCDRVRARRNKKK